MTILTSQHTKQDSHGNKIHLRNYTEFLSRTCFSVVHLLIPEHVPIYIGCLEEDGLHILHLDPCDKKVSVPVGVAHELDVNHIILHSDSQVLGFIYMNYTNDSYKFSDKEFVPMDMCINSNKT